MSEVTIDFAWGSAGLRDRLPVSDLIVIVDALSFSTAVDVAVSRGAEVIPYRYRDDTAAAFAAEHEARLAGPRRAGGPSLSPPSLDQLAAGDRLVLPSPNGATLSTLVDGKPAYAACLRNATAVVAALQAGAAKREQTRIAVIAAGEHWPDGSLRPALEDLLGAGAVLARLKGRLSPDAKAAAAAYRELRGDLADALALCPSGQELIAAGYPDDVAWATAEDSSTAVPLLREGRYSDASGI
ncbi:hypothetical protein HBA54_06120 [Pelagibius litoralis]|uniref:Probable 2-phosphosulfolactate phosphatase n=1 Tax=Pelagibius litoralis TaxID=374515 RepID=A0A967EV92_9PROT|nr:2-phosphosulfolactate phosphatase [Pelagibius litoralis]NIA68162.1 hypothetical protein [Pelagibius litoralis]